MRLPGLLFWGLLALPLMAAELEVCRFRDNKVGAVSLTFDDGTRDHLHRALPLLTKYCFRGTFYIISSRVPAKVSNPESMHGNLTWEEIGVLLDAGHEIGNHSLSHYQLTKEPDPAKLRKEINAPLPIFQEKLGITPETFCYPGCSNTPEIEKIVLEHHLGASRWRVGCGGEKFTLEKWNRELDKIIVRQTDEAMMIHSVVSTGGYAAFPTETMFEECLASLKEREALLWVDTYAAVCRYKLLRDGATLKILSRDNGKIEADLQCAPVKPVTGTLTVCYTGKEKIQVRQNSAVVPTRRTAAGTIFDIAPGKFQIQQD